jgi:hypothetical protein
VLSTFAGGGLFYVILEGDAKQVLQAINSNPPFLSKFGHFIESIHHEKINFRSVDFSFIPREGNAVARALATEASKQKVKIDGLLLYSKRRECSGSCSCSRGIKTEG